MKNNSIRRGTDYLDRHATFSCSTTTHKHCLKNQHNYRNTRSLEIWNLASNSYTAYVPIWLSIHELPSSFPTPFWRLALGHQDWGSVQPKFRKSSDLIPLSTKLNTIIANCQKSQLQVSVTSLSYIDLKPRLTFSLRATDWYTFLLI